MRHIRTITLLVAASLGAQPAPAGGPIENPIPDPIQAGDVHVRLTKVATGLTAPLWGAPSPVDPDRLFVVDQAGTLWAIDLKTGAKSVFLDVAPRLVALGVFGPGTFDERGFLGVAFDPDYSSNGLLYTFTSEPPTGTPDFTTLPAGVAANAQSVIAEWNVPDPTNPASVVDTSTRRELMRIDKPQFNHNGGALAFGPDKLLYVSLGDGGGADDQDGQPFIGGPVVGHGPDGNGQNLGVVLGKILRIDPHGSDSTNGAYGIPGTNPFVGKAGALPEIFAYGLRNPFRFSFDTATGDMYIGDVGQNDIEEIDIGKAGGNYGWRIKEGSFFFDPNGTDAGFVVNNPVVPNVPPDLIDPIAEYDHDEGIAILGGFVYHGDRIPALKGRYVFGDFARTFSNDGRLFYLTPDNTIVEFPLIGRPALGFSLLGFGQDAAGEVYVLVNSSGTPFGTDGAVLRLGLRLAELTGDGVVNSADLAALLGAWGTAGPVADLNGDGVVNGADLALLLGDWG